MSVIRQTDFIDSVADALQFISYYHPVDFVKAVNGAYEREQNPAARDAMAQILINSRMCAEGHRPIFQDKGIVTVFLKIGMDVQWDASMSVSDMVNEGVRCSKTRRLSTRWLGGGNLCRKWRPAGDVPHWWRCLAAWWPSAATSVSQRPSCSTKRAGGGSRCPTRWLRPETCLRAWS